MAPRVLQRVSVQHFAVFLILAFAGIWYFCFLPPRYIRRAQKLQKEMQNKLDVVGIRDWMNKEDPVWVDFRQIPPGRWPPCIKGLDPAYVLLKGQPQMAKLDWGVGHLYAYGIIVGPSSMATPPTNDEELSIEILPGAYVFSQKPPK